MRFLFLLFLFVSITASAQVDLAAGLRAYYPFSGNANDVSGNNNNPSFNNATLATDRFGNTASAYSFNGTSSYMRISNHATINFTNQISVCAWVKTAGYYGGTCHGNSVLSKGDGDFLPGNYVIRFDDNPYTNGQNCSTPVVDQTHQNFYGVNLMAPAPGYTPYIQTGTWHSVVYTSDGTTSKLYVDCELKISAPANGITFTNNHDLYFGKLNSASFPYWFNGTMDEIRIYNRAINADEVKAYGGCPYPTSGTAVSNIINTYTPVLGLLPCENKLTVEDASTFNAGDTVLLIQMKGAVVDSSNSASFGSITDYRSSGNYEINYVNSRAGNVIELKNIITRTYDIPAGKVQLVRVPYYQNATVTNTLTCLPWDGNKGGVLVLNVADSVLLNAAVDVSGRGFRGGSDPFSNPPVYNCYENNFYYPQNPDLASEKGEAIAIVSAAKSFGKGSLANGGGGGNSHNSGGGGGGNAGSGGFGGYNFEGSPCSNTPFDNRGIGGNVLNQTNTLNKLYLGGGGGAGHTNNPQAFEAKGGNGGGIVIILADKIKANGNKILANGADGLTCSGNSALCHEGMGGGGGGGSSFLRIPNYLDNITIEAKGGKGADMTSAGNLKVGPGGGGGGGIGRFSVTTLPTSVTILTANGANGVATAYSNNPFGATAGVSGFNLLNSQVTIDNTPFRPNIDSVRIKDTLITCDSFYFRGQAYTNTNPVSSWQWLFSDGYTANTQNTGHTFSPGNHNVKLVITDINGCRDSIDINVVASVLTMDAGAADTLCAPSSTVLQGTAAGATQYQWSPAIYLNNPNILNPTATPPSTTMFYLNATNTAGCSKTDSVLISVRAANAFTINPPAEICTTATAQLNATGGDIYIWQPAASLNNASISNPLATPTGTTTYTVQITDTLCGNSSQLSTIVTVNSLPVITASRSNDINCTTPNSTLNATGAVQYSWTPAATLNNPSIPGPIATPSITTIYTVAGTDSKGCINTDTVTVKVTTENKGGYLMPTAFTPNNDGLNDCYGIKYWGVITEVEFSIYNRWGQRIFFTRNPAGCWDGTFKGEKQDSGVFVYMIKAKTTCEPSVFRKGTFALIR